MTYQIWKVWNLVIKKSYSTRFFKCPFEKKLHTFSWYEVLNTRFPHSRHCIMWKRVFFKKPTKNVLLCYTNFLTSFASEKNNPSPPPVKKKITYGYLEVTLVYDVANTLLSELEKNMDLRIRLFFVNLGNIWKEITYTYTWAQVKNYPKSKLLTKDPIVINHCMTYSQNHAYVVYV